MKIFTIAVMAFGTLNSAFAANYYCTGKFETKIAFDLEVGKKQVVLSTENSACKAVIDPKYRPTARYAGYSRFKIAQGQFDACKGVVVEMLGSGNSFDSIKVSGELLHGEEGGNATFIYDFGDYHGQLANEKVTCTAN